MEVTALPPGGPNWNSVQTEEKCIFFIVTHLQRCVACFSVCPQQAVNNICSEEGDSASGFTGNGTFFEIYFDIHMYVFFLSFLKAIGAARETRTAAPTGSCSWLMFRGSERGQMLAAPPANQEPRLHLQGEVSTEWRSVLPEGSELVLLLSATCSCGLLHVDAFFISLSYKKLSQLFFCCTAADSFPKLQGCDC